MDLVILEQLVPENHLLRRIDAAVDFSFIHDLCAPLYCKNNGRPAIDPAVIFRMLIVGYLYGIKSEVRLEEEINYNIRNMREQAFLTAAVQNIKRILRSLFFYIDNPTIAKW